MKLEKQKRYEHAEHIKFIKTLPCIINHNCVGPVDCEHWKTKGSGGGDNLSNLNPMCRKHHIEKGQLGVKSFWERYHKTIIENRRKLRLPRLNIHWEVN